MRKPVLGSAVATLSGWIAGWVAVEILSYRDHDWTSHGPGESIARFVEIGILIVPVCSAVFLPLYLKVPRNNFFWRPLVCVPLGALAGFLVLLVVVAGHGQLVFTAYAIRKGIPGAIAGATIWLVATKTYGWFHSDSGSPASANGKLPSIWRWLFLLSIASQATLRAIFLIEEHRFSFYHHYDPWNHPVRAAFVFWTLASTGLFLLAYTPRFFHRLGLIAILAWIASVVTCAKLFVFLFILEFY